MSDRNWADDLRWGCNWGIAAGKVVVLLGPVGFVLQGTIDVLFSPAGLALWLGAAPAACILGGVVVGAIRPIAARGVLGAAVAGIAISLVLGPLLAVADAFLAPVPMDEPEFFLSALIVVGGFLGAILGGLFLPMLHGTEIKLWGESWSTGDPDEPS